MSAPFTVSEALDWVKRKRMFGCGGTYAVDDHEGGLGEGGVEVGFAGLERSC